MAEMSLTRRFVSRFFPLSVLHRRVLYRLRRNVFRQKTAVAAVYDFRMHVPLNVPGIGRALMIFGERELDQYFILGKVLGAGDIVMDIGSNIGYYTSIEAHIVGPTGHIYSFEPDIRNFELLEANLEINNARDITEIFNAPVSADAADVEFHLAEHSNLSSMHLTRGNKNSALVDRNLQDRAYLKTVRLRSIAFCDFLQTATRPVTLVRMDIEGHEAVIFTALADRLERDPQFTGAPRTFVFEPHSWEYTAEQDLATALIRLARFGYRITYLGTRDETRSPIGKLGYKPVRQLLEKRGFLRGVYAGIDQETAIHLASAVDGVTTVCLERQ